MIRGGVAIVAGLFLVSPAASAYQADLVPASHRAEASEIEGSVSIGGEDGTIRVTIENVNDANGDSLDSGALTIDLKLRVNGVRRRVSIPLTVEDGDGQATASLGLLVNDRIVVRDVRVRGPERRTIAQAGLLTRVAPAPPTPGPPPTPSECPAALESCQTDLADCAQELDACEELE